MKKLNLASGASYFRSPSTATAAAIAALETGKTSYGPAEGTLLLREAIASRYKSAGINLGPDQVLVTPGVKQALFNLFSLLLHSERDEVLVPTPAWFGFHELMKYSKGKLVTLATQATDNYTLSPEKLAAALSGNTRVLLLTNPTNPTGRIYSKPELEAILNVAASYPNLYVISDEIYDFVTYGKPVTSILACQGATNRCCVVNGFSKSFAMSGWRVGYMAGETSLIASCTDFQKSTLSGLPEFVQDGAQAVLEHHAQELPAMLAILSENKALMQQHLGGIPEVTYTQPDGSYYLFPDFKAYLNKTTPAGDLISSSTDLCRYLRESYKLELQPGDYFGAPGHIRISFAVEKPELEEAMARLKTALATLTKKLAADSSIPA